MLNAIGLVSVSPSYYEGSVEDVGDVEDIRLLNNAGSVMAALSSTPSPKRPAECVLIFKDD